MTITESPRTLAGRYRLGPLVAPARSSSVHRAHDQRLGRDVAVRVIDLAGLDDADTADVTRAARAAAQVVHPNVAHVHDFGRDGDAAFVVTELQPGRSLADELEDGPLGPDRAAQLNADVSHALAAAHERGVVHGNLSATKVLVADDSRFVVDDFGRGTDGATSADDLAALEALVVRARGGAAVVGEDATVALPVADATSVLPVGAVAAASAPSARVRSANWRIRRRTAAIIAAVVIVVGLALLASARSGGSLTPTTPLSTPTTVTVAPITTAPTTLPPTTAPAPAKRGHDKHGGDG